MLSCTPLQAARIIMKSPSLITLQPGLLQQRTDSLQQLLGCSLEALQKALLRAPAVLASQPDKMQTKYMQLQELLSGDVSKLTTALLRNLHLLARYAAPQALVSVMWCSYKHSMMLLPQAGILHVCQACGFCMLGVGNSCGFIGAIHAVSQALLHHHTHQKTSSHDGHMNNAFITMPAVLQGPTGHQHQADSSEPGAGHQARGSSHGAGQGRSPGQLQQRHAAQQGAAAEAGGGWEPLEHR